MKVDYEETMETGLHPRTQGVTIHPASPPGGHAEAATQAYELASLYWEGSRYAYEGFD